MIYFYFVANKHLYLSYMQPSASSDTDLKQEKNTVLYINYRCGTLRYYDHLQYGRHIYRIMQTAPYQRNFYKLISR